MITQNLFVGNKLWSGAEKAEPSKGFDLRDIKVPIVLFASMGDNITPPQQAFNWVADVYGSTEEIKARGQVIVGLMHENVGHLGIFVSGKVAKKEGTQIASVLKSIEALPPGLYGMQIAEQKDAKGKATYDVSFVELRLEEIAARLNRFKRADERPFEAVKAVSEFESARLRALRAPAGTGTVQRVRREALARVSPAALQRWSSPTSIPGFGGSRRLRRRYSPASALTRNDPARKLGVGGVGADDQALRSIAIARCETRTPKPPSSRSTATLSPLPEQRRRTSRLGF